jgi:hypothetical protein
MGFAAQTTLRVLLSNSKMACPKMRLLVVFRGLAHAGFSAGPLGALKRGWSRASAQNDG